jgi:hypothetical protein
MIEDLEERFKLIKLNSKSVCDVIKNDYSHLEQKIDLFFEAQSVKISKILNEKRSIFIESLNKRECQLVKKPTNKEKYDYFKQSSQTWGYFGRVYHKNEFTVFEKMHYFELLTNQVKTLKNMESVCERDRANRCYQLNSERSIIFNYDSKEITLYDFRSGSCLRKIQVDSNYYTMIETHSSRLLCVMVNSERAEQRCSIMIFDKDLNVIKSRWFDFRIGSILTMVDEFFICYDVTQGKKVAFSYDLDVIEDEMLTNLRLVGKINDHVYDRVQCLSNGRLLASRVDGENAYTDVLVRSTGELVYSILTNFGSSLFMNVDYEENLYIRMRSKTDGVLYLECFDKFGELKFKKHHLLLHDQILLKFIDKETVFIYHSYYSQGSYLAIL